MNKKKWLKAWLSAKNSLKKIKQKELQSIIYKKHWQILDEMIQWACDNQSIRRNTGLIDFQKFILKNIDKIKTFK